MSDGFQKCFSYPAAALVGAVVVGLVTYQILVEPSVQPLRNHPWAKELISPPLSAGVQLTQTVVVPESLANEKLLMAVHLGQKDAASSGDVRITLTQGSHAQTHTLMGLRIHRTIRKRLRFESFQAGEAELHVTGLAGNTASAPGLLCMVGPNDHPLRGPGVPEDIFVSVDWFKIIEGERKLSQTFPSLWVALLWVLPFAGFVSLAWATAGVAQVGDKAG